MERTAFFVTIICMQGIVFVMLIRFFLHQDDQYIPCTTQSPRTIHRVPSCTEQTLTHFQDILVQENSATHSALGTPKQKLYATVRHAHASASTVLERVQTLQAKRGYAEQFFTLTRIRNSLNPSNPHTCLQPVIVERTVSFL